MTTLQSEIEQRLTAKQPEVEVLLAEVLGGSTLRVYIDHPKGVTLATCEQVTLALADMRERYTLEVSSPGIERPLTKPDHFRRFRGRRACVRTRHPLSDRSVSSPGRRSFTGELVGATDSEITLAAEEGLIAIPYVEISRSNLVEE